MKTYLLLFSLCFSVSAFAQNIRIATNENNKAVDEQLQKEKMKADGLTDAVIKKLIAQRKELESSGRKVVWSNAKKNPVVNAACTDMGAENGWSVWQWQVGTNSSGVNPPVFSNPPAPNPAAPNFSITAVGSGDDPNTINTPNPTIPYACPGMGNYSIKVGETCVPNCVAEMLTYPITVTAVDTSFIYSYAIVFEDAAGHTQNLMPFVSFDMFDQLGNPIPCASFIYWAGSGLPGFYPIGSSGCGFAGTDIYKPWTYVGVNLANYVGQTVTAVITNGDCAYCGHWAYSYWDFSCSTTPIQAGCVGIQSTICGPNDPSINYTYQWYQNGNIMSGSTTACIIVTPSASDIFSVDVQQPSGCNFTMNYSASATQSLFTYIANGNTVAFTNLSNGASSYVWDFGDGNTSTQQNPVYSYTAMGTYTVCLIASTSGCSDTTCKVITLTPIAVSENNLLSHVSIFPSPASENLFIDFGNIPSTLGGNAEISFSDLIGQTLFEVTIPASGKQTIDVSEFSEGIYFLKLKTDSGPDGYWDATKKIVIGKNHF